MKNILNTAVTILLISLFSVLSSCKNNSSGPNPEPTPMPSVYIFENAEGANDWFVCIDEFGNKLSDPEIIVPGSNSSGHAVSITFTVSATGTSAPYTGSVQSLKSGPAVHSQICSEHTMATYGGPDLTGYTTMKFDAKIAGIISPGSGTLTYGVDIQSSVPCEGALNKDAKVSFTPSSSWAEISIPMNTFVVSGAYTLAQILGDVQFIAVTLNITSSALNDTAKTVLYLDNIRFE